MSWPQFKIGDLCTLMTGGTPSTNKPEYYEGGTVPWIVSGDIHRKEISGCEKRITELAVEESNARYLPRDSVLIALNGQGKTRGTVALLRMEGATCNQSIVSINPNDKKKLSSDYLFHYLNSQYQNIRNITGDKDRAGLNMPLIRGIAIPLPPLSEQKRITAILDKADAIRRNRQQIIQLADDFLRAVFLDMFGDPATNPKGWPVYKMSEVIDFKGGSQPPKDTFEYEEKEGYVRLVQIRDFRTGKFKTYIPAHLARRRFEVDDVMIGRYGPPVFQILRGLSGAYNVALMKAVPKSGVTKDFVYRLLQLPTYQDAVISNSERTAGQSGVNLDLLNSLDVPLPPIDVQISMSQKIRKIECFLRELKIQLEDAERLFSSLSQSAFSGDL